MGLPGLPKLDLDVKATVTEFLDLLRDMNSKLDTLIELQKQAQGLPTCAECDVKGSLNCRMHGPVRVPGSHP